MAAFTLVSPSQPDDLNFVSPEQLEGIVDARHLAKPIAEPTDFEKAHQNDLKHRTIATVEARIHYLETFVAGWLQEHRQYIQSNRCQHRYSETRLESLEALIVDNADKCTKEIKIAKEKLEELDKSIANCAKRSELSELSELANVDERMNFLVKSMVVDWLKNHQISDRDHEESMKIRLDSLEVLIADHVGKNTKEIQIAKEKLEGLHNAIASCAKLSELANIYERTHFLVKSMAAPAEDLKNHQIADGEHKESMKIRLDCLEALIVDNACKYAKEVETAKEELTIAISATHDDLASVKERINYFEHFFGESMEVCLESLGSLEGVRERMGYLEMSIAKSAEGSANMKLGDLDKAIFDGTKHDQCVRVQERMESLESLVNENADAYAKKLEGAKVKLGDLDKAILDDGAKLARFQKRLNTLTKLTAELTDKLKHHEVAQGEYAESMKIRFESLETKYHQVEERVGSFDNFVGEPLATRLDSLEALIEANASAYAKESGLLKRSLEILDTDKLEELVSIEERMRTLEALISETW